MHLSSLLLLCMLCDLMYVIRHVHAISPYPSHGTPHGGAALRGRGCNKIESGCSTNTYTLVTYCIDAG